MRNVLAAALALLLLAAQGGLEDGEEVATAGFEERVAALEGPLERADLCPRGGLSGGRGALGRRRGRVGVGLLRLEGGGEERVGGGEGIVAEAEEVEEGLAVGEGDGRDAEEARGLDEIGVFEVVVLREEDGSGERVGAARLLGGEGGGGVGRKGVVGAEEDVALL